MYIIKKSEHSITSIDDKIWEIANVANIDKVNWEEFGVIPKTTGKLLYDDYGIYVRLETDEKPLLARYSNQNDKVCCDSCMEFFFRPNENDPRYLNFEFNPFGTMYFAVRTSGKALFIPIMIKTILMLSPMLVIKNGYCNSAFRLNLLTGFSVDIQIRCWVIYINAVTKQ